MPYTIVVYSDERLPIPEVGDVFVVTEVNEATDMHWGKCVVSRVVPLARDAEQQQAFGEQETGAGEASR